MAIMARRPLFSSLVCGRGGGAAVSFVGTLDTVVWLAGRVVWRNIHSPCARAGAERQRAGPARAAPTARAASAHTNAARPRAPPHLQHAQLLGVLGQQAQGVEAQGARLVLVLQVVEAAAVQRRAGGGGVLNLECLRQGRRC